MTSEFLNSENVRFLIGLFRNEIGEIRQEIKTLLSQSYKRVNELPEAGKPGIIYLLPNNSTEEQNVFDEYYWDAESQSFELFGTTKLDLSEYAKKEEIQPILTMLINHAILDSEVEEDTNV